MAKKHLKMRRETLPPLKRQVLRRGHLTVHAQVYVSSQNILPVDLHGMRTTEVRSAILQGVSDAHLNNVRVLSIVHGFNGGAALRTECMRCLSELQKDGTVDEYEVHPQNPGQTLVKLSIE